VAVKFPAPQLNPFRGQACRLLLALLVAVQLAGCGVKLVYNNMDRFARWTMSDYVDMNDEQRDYFDAEIARLLYWHRTHQLQEYADLLETLPTTFSDGADLQEILWVSERMFVWYEEIEVRLVPFAVQMMLSLDDAQVADLPRRLERDNQELAEEELGLSVAALEKRWQREFSDGFSRLVGRLTREQKAYLSQQSVHYIPQYALWADYRRRWQKDVLKLIRAGRDDQLAFAEAFSTLVDARIPVYYGDELTAVFKQNERQYQEVTVWMLNHLTAAQRKKLLVRIAELAESFRELRSEASAQPPAGPACLVRC
jgi:hypothetical protein